MFINFSYARWNSWINFKQVIKIRTLIGVLNAEFGPIIQIFR